MNSKDISKAQKFFENIKMIPWTSAVNIRMIRVWQSGDKEAMAEIEKEIEKYDAAMRCFDPSKVKSYTYIFNGLTEVRNRLRKEKFDTYALYAKLTAEEIDTFLNDDELKANVEVEQEAIQNQWATARLAFIAHRDSHPLFGKLPKEIVSEIAVHAQPTIVSTKP